VPVLLAVTLVGWMTDMTLFSSIL